MNIKDLKIADEVLMTIHDMVSVGVIIKEYKDEHVMILSKGAKWVATEQDVICKLQDAKELINLNTKEQNERTV